MNLSKEDIARIRALIYLYFDGIEIRYKDEMENKIDRILMNGRNLSYDDAIKILKLKVRVEILETIEKELYELLDSL